jgi:HK97 family phage major capsid protein
MAEAFAVTRMRLERLADERERTNEKIEDLLKLAEEEARDLADYEREQVAKYRTRVEELEEEITALATDIERAESAKDISRLVRPDEVDEGEPVSNAASRRWATPRSDGPVVYRTFAEYARDQLIVRYPEIAQLAAGRPGDVPAIREEAQERLQRTPGNTISSVIPGLTPATHFAQIMDVIDASRPVVASGRSVPLDRGSMTYPKIGQRPTVSLQATEKAEGGTAELRVSMETLTAETYIGGGDLSWQAINWSTPDALQLWFDLAAEAWARQTEEAACDVLEDSTAGTLGTTAGRLGTAGTESFGDWRKAVVNGLSSIYTTMGGRTRTDTLYLSANRFFQLAKLGSDEVVQMSAVGNLDVGAMTGTFSGLRVVGSYGFDTDVAIIGDSAAFLVGQNPGNPVELRAVEPSIGGMEVGVIGAFKSAVFDINRFLHLGINE